MTEAVTIYREDRDVLDVQTRSAALVDRARALVIVDDTTNAEALDMLSSARKFTKQLDALKKHWLDPLNKQIKVIREDFEAWARPASEADAVLSTKTRDYRAAVIAKERAEQARLAALAEKRQERAEARAEAKGEPAPPAPLPAPVMPLPSKTVVTETAKVTFREQVHFEIVDADAVPREWCKPDETKIGAAVRSKMINEKNQIAGVRVWVTEEATVR